MLTQSPHLAAIASLTLLFIAGSTHAANPSARLIEPHHGHHCDDLPKFGMHTFNDGYGERVVRVRYGGLAWQLGIERGDLIERLNRVRLNYHGSWRHALRNAMLRQGGRIVLRVRDEYTGRVAHRYVDLSRRGRRIDPPVGPITPKYAPVARGGYEPRQQPLPQNPRLLNQQRRSAARPVMEDRFAQTPDTLRETMQRRFSSFSRD